MIDDPEAPVSLVFWKAPISLGRKMQPCSSVSFTTLILATSLATQSRTCNRFHSAFNTESTASLCTIKWTQADCWKWRIKSSGIQRRVIGWVVLDIAWSVPTSKHHKPLTKWHGIISQMTRTLSKTPLRTSNLAWWLFILLYEIWISHGSEYQD